MSLQCWLGETSISQFVEQHYYRLPFSGSIPAEKNTVLASWESFGELLATLASRSTAESSVGEPAPSCAPADVMVVKEGARSDGPLPQTLPQAQRLLEEGHTILFRHAEQLSQELRDLADAFAADFAAPVNIHIYATGEQQFGFGWHYDAEEVFILQTLGAKEYSLRKNTVNPWPLEETIPHDMAYPREIMPLMKCLLQRGDWIYLPAGYWHKAFARESSLSLAIGVMAPAAIDIYDALRKRLLDSLLWRQRLPPRGEASPCDSQTLREHYRQLLQQLSQDLTKALESEEFLDELFQRD